MILFFSKTSILIILGLIFDQKIHLNVLAKRENSSQPIFCNKTEGQFVAEKVARCFTL